MALTWRYAASVGTNNGDETSHTHSAVPVGAADADRWVIAIVGVSRNSTTAITSVTIGGVAATAHPENASTIPAGSDGSYVYWANVPSGTTANIVISYNGTTWNGHAAVWTVDGEPSFHDRQRDTTPISVGYNPVYDGDDQQFSVAIDVPEGGSLIAQSHIINLNYAVWSGATERWENLAYEGHSGADADGLSAQTGRTVSVTFNGVASEDYLDVVTFTVAGGGGVSGALAAVEAGGDTAAFAGAGASPPITGSVAAIEAGSDVAAIAGRVPVTGSLAATETGSDTAAFGFAGEAPPRQRGDDAFHTSGHRERFWREKAEEQLEGLLVRAEQAATAPQKARRRVVEAFALVDWQKLPEAPRARDLLVALRADEADYTHIAALVMQIRQQIEAERTKRRRKRDIEAIMVLAA